jgi:hypothetical protein
MEENGRKRDWKIWKDLGKSWKDLERSWCLGPKQDLLEMLRGSPMFLKEGKEISQVSLHIFVVRFIETVWRDWITRQI